ncbi:hypothetical protein L211DRAFT_266144 [Terfezia boudieri ATCC MYA-4762]|uniref:Uncharacterized protein n=1 Tax=Terfezia boudieri ATCC MYA-4762 TaxID=1051890 RepID=A0A3N4M622_9PEZI|nr:hypothetical protein L211DRAFT_266144 [Terfezia boudieri ATCC MYA-4762]
MTLFGQSGNAVSVTTYMFSYSDDPIAHGFIAESPYDIGDGYPSEFPRVAKNARAGGEREVFNCMMKVDAKRLALHSVLIYGPSKSC